MPTTAAPAPNATAAYPSAAFTLTVGALLACSTFGGV